MAEIFNLKKGNTENLGLRWLGAYMTNSRARYGIRSTIHVGGKYAYSVDSDDVAAYPSAFSGTAQNFADYWNNPANYSFRNHIMAKVREKIKKTYGDTYVRAMSEWDTIVIPVGNLQENVYEYVDLRRVQKLTYKGSPVFRLKKDGVTTFQRQIASGADTRVYYPARTMTSITWRVTNDDDANILANVYALVTEGTSQPDVSELYYSGSHPTGTLKDFYKKNYYKIAGGHYYDFTSTGLTPNTLYSCTAVLGDNATSLYHSVPGHAIKNTEEGILVSFYSATKSSISFKYTNKTNETTSNIFAGTTSPGNSQISNTSVAPGDNTFATLTGLTPNTSYTIYVRGYSTENGYTATASFTGKTLASLQKPSILRTNGNYCKPLVTINNPNSVKVTVIADTGSNPTTPCGTISSGTTADLHISVGSNPSGQTKTFYVRFYNQSEGYSDIISYSVKISSSCIAT